jgi:hypothetical protein
VLREWDEPASPYDVAIRGRARRHARDLSEVRELRASGWHLMDPGLNRQVVLTAVWPADHRIWIPDRTNRVERRYVQYPDGTTKEWSVPVTDEMRAEVESEMNADLATYGLPPRPPGRPHASYTPVNGSTGVAA